ncbi:hypothetical protein SUDANB145_05201 [Streptomyces sp. enrichment culture]
MAEKSSSTETQDLHGGKEEPRGRLGRAARAIRSGLSRAGAFANSPVGRRIGGVALLVTGAGVMAAAPPVGLALMAAGGAIAWRARGSRGATEQRSPQSQEAIRPSPAGPAPNRATTGPSPSADALPASETDDLVRKVAAVVAEMLAARTEDDSMSRIPHTPTSTGQRETEHSTEWPLRGRLQPGPARSVRDGYRDRGGNDIAYLAPPSAAVSGTDDESVLSPIDIGKVVGRPPAPRSPVPDMQSYLPRSGSGSPSPPSSRSSSVPSPASRPVSPEVPGNKRSSR